MPVQATCCRCKREFPVKAVMSLAGVNIPLLVVLSEVNSVEEAIALATCQVCLNKDGPSDRGLHVILTRLGCTEVQAGGLHMDQRTLQRSRTQAGPSMSGVRVVLPKMPDKQRGPFRRPAPPREPSLDERQRLPKVLEESFLREPESKPEPLRVPLIEADQAQLRALRKKIREQNSARFQEMMPELHAELDRVRGVASHEDVDAAVEALLAKVGEAVRLDPDQRGKAMLLRDLQTSEAELESLRLIFWATHTIIPKKSGGNGGEGEAEDRDTYEARPHEPRSLVIGIKLEEVEENPFPDGRRPRHFDRHGEGRQATLHPVIVVRAKSDLPRVANKALGEPEGPCPKVVYPKDGQYGKVFTVQESRRVSPKDRSWGRAQGALLLWAADHPESVVPLDLICSYLEPFLDEPSEVVNESDDALSQEETQPHTEV